MVPWYCSSLHYIYDLNGCESICLKDRLPTRPEEKLRWQVTSPRKVREKSKKGKRIERPITEWENVSEYQFSTPCRHLSTL